MIFALKQNNNTLKKEIHTTMLGILVNIQTLQRPVIASTLQDKRMEEELLGASKIKLANSLFCP